jgi:hypothetical protein
MVFAAPRRETGENADHPEPAVQERDRVPVDEPDCAAGAQLEVSGGDQGAADRAAVAQGYRV